jgi:hypothetical protein
MVLPGAFGVSAARIDGDATANGLLGFWLTGSGYFYGTSGGTGMIATAPYVTTAAGVYAGRLYSFGGRSGVVSTIAYTAARHTFDGTIAVGTIGGNSIAPLGDVGPGGQPAFGLPFPAVSSSVVQMRSGTAAEGPFGEVEIVSSVETSANRVFGRYVAGGGIAGTSTTMSLVGSNKSDVAISTIASGVPRVFVVDGTRVSVSLAGTTANIESIADVVAPLYPYTSGSWTGTSRGTTLIRDADADGFADLVLGDVSFGSSAIDGRIVILR